MCHAVENEEVFTKVTAAVRMELAFFNVNSENCKGHYRPEIV